MPAVRVGGAVCLLVLLVAAPAAGAATSELPGEVERLLGAGREEEALALSLRSASELQAAGDLRGAAGALLLAGEIEASARRHEPALVTFREAAALAQRVGDDVLLRSALEATGLQAALTGRLREAVDSYRRVLALLGEPADPEAEGTSRITLGYALQSAGRIEEALEQYRLAGQAFRAARSVEPDAQPGRGELVAVLNAATAEYAWSGRDDEAIAAFEEILRAAQKGSFELIQANCWLNIAEAHTGLGRYRRALAALDRARLIYRRHGEIRWLAASEVSRSRVYRGQENWRRAREAARRAERLARLAGDQNVVRMALQRQGQALEALGEHTAALDVYRRSVDLVERLRREAGSEELQVSFFRNRLDTYEDLVGLLHRLSASDPEAGWEKEALRASESARCRSFLDLLPSAPGAGTPTDPLDAGQIQKLLDDDTLLVEYLVGESTVQAFAVTNERILFLDLGSAAELTDRAAFLAGSLRAAGKSSARAWRPAARRLRRELLEPLLAARPGARSLIVVPDGPLHLLPFEALVDPEGMGGAGREIAVSYVPSASILATLRDRTAPAVACDLLAVAVERFAGARGDGPPEPLPLAPREVAVASRAVARGRARVIDRDATESAVRAALDSPCRLVHFATHARLDGVDPGDSALLLAADSGEGASEPPGTPVDGRLTAREIAQMHLPSDLVVLSACGTGLGEISPREGVLGLSRSFLRAGTRAMLVTLWKVSDRAALRMTTLFYAEAARGLPLDRALAAARRRFGPGEERLAFVLVGDGSRRLDGILVDIPDPRFQTGLLLVGAGIVLALALLLRARP